MQNITLDVNHRNKIIKIEDFTIHYENFASAKQTIEEIFIDLPYQFISTKSSPFIIDGGSNIGIASFFFKKLYPSARLLCFEPDPVAFKTLACNVADNHLRDVEILNVALSQEEGEVDFFGQIFVDSPDARGNSIINTWGMQRDINNIIKVKSTRLSSYINSEVDFLKLDVEGAEQQVLQDLHNEGKLAFIKEIAIEIHQSSQIDHINNLDVITNLLTDNKFDVTVTKKSREELLPQEIKQWVEKVNPSLFALRAAKL